MRLHEAIIGFIKDIFNIIICIMLMPCCLQFTINIFLMSEFVNAPLFIMRNLKSTYEHIIFIGIFGYMQLCSQTGGPLNMALHDLYLSDSFPVFVF